MSNLTYLPNPRIGYSEATSKRAMTMLNALRRAEFDNHCLITVPSHAHTDIAGKQTKAKAIATTKTETRSVPERTA